MPRANRNTEAALFAARDHLSERGAHVATADRHQAAVRAVEIGDRENRIAERHRTAIGRAAIVGGVDGDPRRGIERTNLLTDMVHQFRQDRQCSDDRLRQRRWSTPHRSHSRDRARANRRCA
jgi:hypothetical protein